MSYTITKTNGVTIGTILDGTINTSATSLTLVGRNYSNYGQIMTDNLVQMLENFAYNISPSNPLEGQLWWNTGDKRLRVWTGAEYKVVSSCTAQTTAPSTTLAGDLWWDTANDQLYVYNGTTPFAIGGWVLIGPGYSKINGKSGALREVLTDNAAGLHTVVSIWIDDTRIGIISEDSEFTPAAPIAGFSTIKPGYNMSSVGIFSGTANNASFLGNQPAASYMRNDINNTVTGSLTMNNDSGITIGVGNDLQLSVTGIHSQVKNLSSGGNLSLHTNVSGTDTRSLHIKGTDGLVEVFGDPTTDMGVATKQYVDNSFIDSVLTGVPVAPTAPFGTANTMVATTEFVVLNSGFYSYKIYDGNNHMWMSNVGGVGAANLVINGTTVMTSTVSGVDLKNGATATTQTQDYNTTGNARVATTQFVKTATQWWDGSAKWVSTDAPDAGVNDIGSNDGDIWFQREL
jgi:hypothetical protein